MDLCNINQVKQLLARHNFRFSKTLGQNFLCDASVPRRIAQMCGADGECGILEVGPGIGALTCRLAEVGAEVAAVEIDRALLPLLEQTLADYDNVTIISGDILKYNIAELVSSRLPYKRVIACANLPYYITSPVLEALLEAGCFDSVCVMVQREVARRCCADCGTSDYSAFSVYINYHAEPEILFDIPPDSFIPQPKVYSSVMRLKIRKTPPYPDLPKHKYLRVVRAAFAQRRKTMVNSLHSVFGAEYSKEQLAQMIERCGFLPNVRGEQLSPDDFYMLAKQIYKNDTAVV